MTAPHAWEAFRILDSERRLDLFLADIRLPPGMPHGFAMARMARNRRPDLKVLYVTAYREIAEIEADRALGKILYKPIRPDAVVAEVARALERLNGAFGPQAPVWRRGRRVGRWPHRRR